MKFFIDAMFSPAVSEYLNANGHDAISPYGLGVPGLPDYVIVQKAIEDNRVVVTENVRDFAHVTDCTVVFALKAWWPPEVLTLRLAGSLERWANANPNPGLWPHWLDAKFR